MSSVAVDGETAVAWGERDGVLYILDVYEVEASCAEPTLPLNTFRPMFLPKARPMSQKPGIVLAAAVAICTSIMGAALLRIIINTIRNHQ